MKRDFGVELIRVIACSIVIGVHVCLGTSVGGRPDIGRLYIACVFADGVAVFWLIMGFFLFDNNCYSKLLLRTIRSIVIPMFLFSVILFFTGEWLIDGAPFFESIKNANGQIPSALKTLLTWRNPVKNAGHLWYLYIYVLVIVIFPVLKAFVVWVDQDVKRQKYFILITFTLLMLNDLTNNKLAAFSHYSINGLFPASIQVIWGHIFYKNRRLVNIKYFSITSILLFGMINVLRCIIQFNRYQEGLGDSILYWYSSIGLICALCICIFILSLKEKIRSEKIQNNIIKVASYTFLIYLIHTTIYKVIRRFGLHSCLISGLHSAVGEGWIFELIYTIAILLIVFMVSFAVRKKKKKCWSYIKNLVNLILNTVKLHLCEY